jgi:hypothetical protein
MSIVKTILVSVALLLLNAFLATATPIVSSQLISTLTSGSLAGTSIPVSFSYDAGQVLPSGDSFITLSSINFTLLGVAFAKNNIDQGGQVVFHNGVIENLTASFQGTALPSNSPVENITFGFGGPGVIGYIDLNGQNGTGEFTFVAEPPTAILILLSGALFGIGQYRSKQRS